MVFHDRKFIVIIDQTEDITAHDALCNLITSNGGEIVAWDSRTNVDVSPKLIIVSNSMDYDRAEEMKRFMIPTVTSGWVHFCVKENKLVPTRPFSPDPRNFMREVIACFSNLLQGDSDLFKAAIEASGGETTDQVTRYTTHVVANSLDTPECQLVLESQKNNPEIDIKLVQPSWLDACMSLQIKVNDTPYLLTQSPNTSSLLNQAETQLNLTATFPLNDSPRLAVQNSMRDDLGSEILANRLFYLSDDLDLSERVLKTVKYLIETNGGRLTTDLSMAQVYLGKFREGDDYIMASRRRIIIGNITWLYWTLIHQKFEKPTHLLHYPEVNGGLLNANKFNICITNYTGDARAYLQSLIHSLGANYSGKLIENHTTHLITAYESGQKYEAAKKWGIPIVNHLWLEDSYAYWQPQDPQNRVYTYFPPKLSLSTLIGTRNLVANVLQKFQNPQTDFIKPPHPKRQAKQKAGNWLHDAMIVENEFHQQLRRGKVPLIEETVENLPKRKTPTPPPKPATPTPPATGISPKPKPTPPNEPLRIMFSGVEDPPTAKACSKINLTLAKSTPVDILVAPKFMKTAKFLQCLAHTQEFVTPNWIKTCIAEHTLLPTDKYRINDKALSQALKNREALNGKPLFDNLKLALAPDLKDQLATFKQFVKAHGGQTTSNLKDPKAIVIGNTDPSHAPMSKLIECMQLMDPSILTTVMTVHIHENI